MGKTKGVYINLQRCMDSIIVESNVVCAHWEDQIAQMNQRFAVRVLQYLCPQKQPKISMVKRDFGKSLDIYVSDGIKYDTSKLQGMIRDKVNIIRTQETDVAANDMLQKQELISQAVNILATKADQSSE